LLLALKRTPDWVRRFERSSLVHRNLPFYALHYATYPSIVSA
jgi:hypothetical protein